MSDAGRPPEADLPPDLAILRGQLEVSAIERLAATNWFPPFALAMLTDGKIVDYSATVPAEQATPELIYKVLVGGLSAGARQGRFRAVGLCHGAVMKNGQNAVRIVLEQPGGIARELLRPYEKRGGNTAPSLLLGTVTATTPAIFHDDEP